ncbi:hypothetical protein M1N46_02790 [Dehalococcoidia bacterium]|nr:hypothetical protein [Dehalococcoidia bacterium]
MTKARQRYEAKTRVVTFRVHQEVYNELEKVKAGGQLSYSDLVKLGAGIAQEEIKAKQAEISGLKAEISSLEEERAQLRSSVKREQLRLSESLNEERNRRLKELATEMEAFKLFDRGWRVETISYKLGIPQTMAHHYFKEWAKERKDKEAVERDLLKRCLKKHIDRLVERRLWDGVLGRLSKEELEADQKHIDECWRLLAAPEQMCQEDKEFLITKYSRILEPAPRSNRF